MTARRAYPNPYLGPVVHLSPSGLEEWESCRRRYRNRHLLGIPAPDDSPGADVGHVTHELLQQVHDAGVCAEPDAVAAIVAAHPRAQPDVHGRFLSAHRNRCPTSADWSRHEAELVRFARHGHPRWLLVGRIDAMWARGSILDVRDYKTGTVRVDRVADSLAAKAQAYLAAPIAAEHGLQLRITYEHLNGEDGPDPWDVEDEDLEAVTAELHAHAAAIAAEETFAGCAHPPTCRWCPYVSCPDRAEVPELATQTMGNQCPR